MSVVQRHGLVRKMGACRKCLKGKHFARECSETMKCQACESPTHHTLLHFDTRQLMGREMGQATRGFGRGGNFGRNMNRVQVQAPNRTFGVHQATASAKFIDETQKPQVNNDVMFAKMATNMESLTEQMSTIGNYIKDMKSMTALNTSNNLVTQPQLKTSSVMNSIDENKNPTTYFRLITCFLVDYLEQLIRINAIIDEGSTDSFITRALVEELRLLGVDICSKIATIGNNVQTVQSKLVVATMKSIDGKETHTLECQMMEEINSNIVVPNMKEIIKQFPWMARFSFHRFAKRPVQMLIGLNGLHLIRALASDTHGTRFEPSIRDTIWGPTMVMRVDEVRRIQPSRRAKRRIGVVLHTT
jgi:hypothetical protein